MLPGADDSAAETEADADATTEASRTVGVAGAVAAALGEIGTGRAQHQFDETGCGLEAFRAADEIHSTFVRLFERQALDDHATGRCALDARGLSLESAEAAMLMGGGALWPEEEQRDLLETVASVPQPVRAHQRPRNLEDLEAEEFADRFGLSVADLASGIGLDDVSLDVGADLQDDTTLRCGGQADRCTGGLFCGPGGRRRTPPSQHFEGEAARRKAAGAWAPQRKITLPAAVSRPPKRQAVPGDNSPSTPPAEPRHVDGMPSRFGT